MLDKVKNALRIKTAAFDGEVEGLIAACKADLHLVGVVFPEAAGEAPAEIAGDPLIERAIILYAKAAFGYFEDSEKYQRAYDCLKCSLSLAGDYDAVD
jgi:hypothetical protein